MPTHRRHGSARFNGAKLTCALVSAISTLAFNCASLPGIRANQLPSPSRAPPAPSYTPCDFFFKATTSTLALLSVGEALPTARSDSECPHRICIVEHCSLRGLTRRVLARALVSPGPANSISCNVSVVTSSGKIIASVYSAFEAVANCGNASVILDNSALECHAAVGMTRVIPPGTILAVVGTDHCVMRGCNGSFIEFVKPRTSLSVASRSLGHVASNAKPVVPTPLGAITGDAEGNMHSFPFQSRLFYVASRFPVDVVTTRARSSKSASFLKCVRHVRLLVAVFSAPAHIAERNAIRNSWAKDASWQSRGNVCVVFVVAGNWVALNEPDVVSVVGTPEQDDALLLKTIGAFSLLHHATAPQFLLKVREDTAVHIGNALQLVDSMPQSNVYAGHVLYDQEVYSDPLHHNYEPLAGGLRKYPPYASCTACLLSSDIVQLLLSAVASGNFKWLRNEDAAIGLALFASGVQARHIPDRFFLEPPAVCSKTAVSVCLRPVGLAGARLGKDMHILLCGMQLARRSPGSMLAVRLPMEAGLGNRLVALAAVVALVEVMPSMVAHIEWPATDETRLHPSGESFAMPTFSSLFPHVERVHDRVTVSTSPLTKHAAMQLADSDEFFLQWVASFSLESLVHRNLILTLCTDVSTLLSSNRYHAHASPIARHTADCTLAKLFSITGKSTGDCVLHLRMPPLQATNGGPDAGKWSTRAQASTMLYQLQRRGCSHVQVLSDSDAEQWHRIKPVCAESGVKCTLSEGSRASAKGIFDAVLSMSVAIHARVFAGAVQSSFSHVIARARACRRVDLDTTLLCSTSTCAQVGFGFAFAEPRTPMTRYSRLHPDISIAIDRRPRLCFVGSAQSEAEVGTILSAMISIATDRVERLAFVIFTHSQAISPLHLFWDVQFVQGDPRPDAVELQTCQQLRSICTDEELDNVIPTFHLETGACSPTMRRERLDWYALSLAGVAPINTELTVLVTATGKYTSFLGSFVADIRRFFAYPHRVSVIVFSDVPWQQSMPESNSPFENRVRVTSKLALARPWPMSTALRALNYLDHSDAWRKSHFVLCLDVDMSIVRSVSLEDVYATSVAAHHPGYWKQDPITMPFEPRQQSAAFVPPEKRKAYFAGGVFGGVPERVLDLLKEFKDLTNRDKLANIVPVWHDESYMNNLWAANPPARELHPGYVFPEPGGASYPHLFANEKPIVPISIVALNKDHTHIRQL